MPLGKTAESFLLFQKLQKQGSVVPVDKPSTVSIPHSLTMLSTGRIASMSEVSPCLLDLHGKWVLRLVTVMLPWSFLAFSMVKTVSIVIRL